VQELDRVLDRDDVELLLAVDLVDHRGRVVVLPEPVGPLTRISPRGFSQSSSTTGGRPSSLNPRIS
jgi:hypothetical protein